MANDNLLIHFAGSDGAPNSAELRQERSSDAVHWTGIWRQGYDIARRIAAGEGDYLEPEYDHVISSMMLGDISLVHWQQPIAPDKVNRTLVIDGPLGKAILTTHMPRTSSASQKAGDRTKQRDLAKMAQLAYRSMAASCGIDDHDILCDAEIKALQSISMGVGIDVHNSSPYGEHRMGTLHWRTPISRARCVLDNRDPDDTPSTLEDLPMAISIRLLGVTKGNIQKCPRIFLKPYAHTGEIVGMDPVAKIRAMKTFLHPDETPITNAIAWETP